MGPHLEQSRHWWQGSINDYQRPAMGGKISKQPQLKDIIKSEKIRVAGTSSLDDLENLRTYWEGCKAVFDLIARSISPLDTLPIIHVDLSKLQLPPKITDGVMLALLKDDVLSGLEEKPRNPIVVSTTSLRRYLKGETVVIKDAKRFNALHERVSDLVSAIERRYGVLSSEIVKVAPQTSVQQGSLSDPISEAVGDVLKVSFDDTTAMITIGDKRCQLPKYKNEYDLCRIMFKQPVGTSVSWDVVYDEINGTKWTENEHTKKKITAGKRAVQDTVYRFNNRIENEIGVGREIFKWRSKGIVRNL